MTPEGSAPDRARPAHAPLLTLRDVQAAIALASGSARSLFIHIPKNAGVSLRRAPALRWKMVGVHRQFLGRAYLRDLLAAMGAAGEHHGIAHARLRDVKPAIAARLRPVAILRNPWARTVSRFQFAQSDMARGKRAPAPEFDSFEAFLETRHADGARPYFWHRAIRGWYPQRDYVVDAEGRIAADLLRQEHLGTEAAAYFDLAAPPRRRNVTRGGRRDWREYYTPRTVEVVADWYAADIETFGFDFDTPATRNVWAEGAR